VVAQADDTHSYHIQFEIMPKIIYHLKFLLDNPQVKILIGCDFATDKNRNTFFLFFMTRLISVFLKRCGISKDRLIVQKNVFAEIVYLPTAGNQLDNNLLCSLFSFICMNKHMWLIYCYCYRYCYYFFFSKERAKILYITLGSFSLCVIFSYLNLKPAVKPTIL
jgi:hypothetical protein